MADWTLDSERTVCCHTMEFSVNGVDPIIVGALKLRPFKFTYQIDQGYVDWILTGKRILKSGAETTTHSIRRWDIKRTQEWLDDLLTAAHKRARDNGWIEE